MNEIIEKKILPIKSFKYPTPSGDDGNFDDFMKQFSFMMALTEAAMDLISSEIVNHIEEEKISKNLVYYMLVEKNSEFTEIPIPKRDILNMDIIYFLYLGGIGPLHRSILITNEMLDKWKMTEEELYKIAKENTPNLFPFELYDQSNGLNKINKNFDENFPTVDGLFICSNKIIKSGAISIFYENKMKEFADENNGMEIFILPSSRDFMVICLIKEEKVTQEILNSLKKMYQEISMKTNVISNEILYYNRLTNDIEIL